MLQGLFCHCRFTSDAVTGVAVVTVLFFFPSQRPSLKWWFDFKGKVFKAGVSVSSVSSVAWRRGPGLGPERPIVRATSHPFLPHSLFPVQVATLSGHRGLPEVTLQGRGQQLPIVQIQPAV